MTSSVQPVFSLKIHKPHGFSCDIPVGMQLLCVKHMGLLARELGFGHINAVCLAFQEKLLTALDSEITDSYFSPGVGVKTHKQLNLIIAQC